MSQDERTAREERNVAICRQVIDALSLLSKEERLAMLSSVLGMSVCAIARNRGEAAQLLGLSIKEAFEMVYETFKE
jgi:hypothetical protein